MRRTRCKQKTGSDPIETPTKLTRDEAEVKGYYAAIHDFIVVDRDKLGIHCGRRQNHIIVCMRFLGNRDTGGR
jgi:hypothetical protein